MPGSSRLKYVGSLDAWGSLARSSLRRAAFTLRQITGAIPQAPLSGPESLAKELRSQLSDWSSRERKPPSILSDPCLFGGDFERDRIRAVAKYCISAFPGDLLEIGCYLGGTTRVLAEVAKAHGRRVIAVDPWEVGTQNCAGTEYDQFLQNIKDYEDSVDIMRLSSFSPEAIQRMKQRKLCMALVDGLHTYEAALSDIRAVSHCAGIIAVDDVACGFEVMLAMRQAAHELGRKALHLAPAKEGYLIG